MSQLIFLAIMGLVIYVVFKLSVKEPLLPWKEKKVQANQKQSSHNTNGKKQGKGKYDPLEEDEAAPFNKLFPEIQSLESHMIRHKNNTFTMIGEVTPVNYFLLDEHEQAGIDATFETWLAQITYPVRIYMQNRRIDLTEPIEEIQRNMESDHDLHPAAIEYGQNMIDSLKMWQLSQPRFETKRFILFDYKVDEGDIRADSKEEREEKIVDKAFNELYRRLNTAKGQLRKADIKVDLLTVDGISETLYYTFNRKKAMKNRYRDIEKQEQLATYVTADQKASQIAKVKGELENVQIQKEAI